MTYNPQNNPKWQATGRMFNKRKYTEMPETELEQKKRLAEIWLLEHPNNIHYQEALKKYEEICDQLYSLSGNWVK